MFFSCVSRMTSCIVRRQAPSGIGCCGPFGHHVCSDYGLIGGFKECSFSTRTATRKNGHLVTNSHLFSTRNWWSRDVPNLQVCGFPHIRSLQADWDFQVRKGQKRQRVEEPDASPMSATWKWQNRWVVDDWPWLI